MGGDLHELQIKSLLLAKTAIPMAVFVCIKNPLTLI
jgi:hypothetical protein